MRAGPKEMVRKKARIYIKKSITQCTINSTCTIDVDMYSNMIEEIVYIYAKETVLDIYRKELRHIYIKLQRESHIFMKDPQKYIDMYKQNLCK